MNRASIRELEVGQLEEKLGRGAAGLGSSEPHNDIPQSIFFIFFKAL